MARKVQRRPGTKRRPFWVLVGSCRNHCLHNINIDHCHLCSFPQSARNGHSGASSPFGFAPSSHAPGGNSGSGQDKSSFKKPSESTGWSSSDDRALLTSLAARGYHGVQLEDLGKLNPPDKFDTEMRIMSEVRGYFEIVYTVRMVFRFEADIVLKYLVPFLKTENCRHHTRPNRPGIRQSYRKGTSVSFV